ncbi:TRAP-type mannitol/chloroaromatic compound transport system, small permease component [Reichenbachiella agariperforans]|uniref:TRAP-type mannitol/chloroaromatic compound transport system, small permease component n=1 Tax=Reichenbachiella agariperforans TaxID=156994 RepID=A0A1M6QA71_REIAG|nr:TRAP transporter small permease subunit [Reichenbachiella agariperforans]SHK17179.1 TRAP-type mannitol/chloroaromatic compound transport system, small permease component [Reichenbachiella agariperforans]
MNKIVNWINLFTDKTGSLVSYISVILVVLIAIDVVLRYLFSWTSSANQELEWHLFAALFLLGAAYTLRHDKHVRVDLFYSRFSIKTKAWINLLGTLIFLMPFCWAVLYTSVPFVIDAWNINESSPEPGGLPHRFLVKSTIPISAILLSLQGVAITLDNLSTILNPTAS